MRRRGIYLLPNIFTTTSLFFGFYSITAAIGERFTMAASVLFISMLLDNIDGRLARMTNTESEFGKQYDSLSDLVCFGVAPAILIYQWILSDLGEFGAVIAFVYAATAALRLARYNAQAVNLEKAFFQGLPSPAAAALLCGYVWLAQHIAYPSMLDNRVVAMVLCLLSAGLMVSNVRYHSFKQFDLKGRMPLWGTVLIILAIALVAANPSLVLFVAASIYIVSGPLLTLIAVQRHRKSTNEKSDK